jgi:hypothetical protein
MGTHHVFRRRTSRTRSVDVLSRRPPQRVARSIGDAPHTVLQRARTGNDQHGRVLASFRHGHYVKFGTTVFAIGQERIHAGPLHLLYAGPLPLLRTDSPITMSPDRLWSRQVEIDLRRATRWDPLPPGTESLESSLEMLERICQPLPPPDLDVDWRSVEWASRDEDLTSLRLLLEGRGPGLTPVGDDVLAGVLFLRALARPDDRRLAMLAQSAATSDLSRGFLHWAGRGHSIEPVHRLIRQAGIGHEDAAEQTAAIIANIGASSGPALLAGIGLAAGAIQSEKGLRASLPQVVEPSRS